MVQLEAVTRLRLGAYLRQPENCAHRHLKVKLLGRIQKAPLSERDIAKRCSEFGGSCLFVAARVVGAEALKREVEAISETGEVCLNCDPTVAASVDEIDQVEAASNSLMGHRPPS